MIVNIFDKIAFYLESVNEIESEKLVQLEKIFKNIFCEIFSNEEFKSTSKGFIEVFIAYSYLKNNSVR